MFGYAEMGKRRTVKEGKNSALSWLHVTSANPRNQSETFRNNSGTKGIPFHVP